VILLKVNRVRKPDLRRRCNAEAEQAAQIRATLKTQGQPIGAYDVLIAPTALQHNLIMVTANQREFDRISGLQTENWRQA
jgi:tRNA(fMet)-specific endonuclease VapC